jgi:hypothetical protein
MILAESRDAPELAERLDRPGCHCRPHVRRVPAELLQNIRDRGLGLRIVPSEEHRRPSSGKRRIDHAGAADAVERLHQASLGEGSLQLLEQRAVRSGEDLDDPIDRSFLGDRIVVSMTILPR